MPVTCPLPLPLLQPSSQRGAGVIEFTIVALPVLLIGLGSIELSHWFYTRQAISVALLDAGRAAITQHMRADHTITAFEHAIRPLYASPTADSSSSRLHDALKQRERDMNGPPWQIEVLSPSAAAYTDFADPTVHIEGASGRAVINNHYLAEQNERHRTQGWTDGRGPVSGQTIYEANTTVLRLSWLHKPRLPLVVPILRALGDSQGSYRQRALHQGYLPMTRQITLLMQSHPVQWTDDRSGKILYHPEGNLPAQVCSGWLCNADQHAGTASEATPPADDQRGLPLYPATPVTTPPVDGLAPNNPDSGNVESDGLPSTDPDLPTDLDDPACGITLCCL